MIYENDKKKYVENRKNIFKNKSTTCRCQHSSVECLIVIKKVEIKKTGIILTKMHLRVISVADTGCSFDSEHLF